MAGFLPDEGEAFIADFVIKQTQTANRGTDLELGLFTNTGADETLVHASVTEPSGTGYARITLTDGSWTGSTDARSYAQQTFTAGAGGWTGTVKGYFICTKGSTKRLLALEIDGAGPYTMNASDTYKVTPTLTLA